MATEFTMDVSKFVDKAQVKVNDAVRGAMNELCNRIIDRTPVDTGRCVGNWILTVDGELQKMKTGVKAKSREHPKNRVAKALSHFDIHKNTVMWFTNTLEYAIPLEYGWSKQAPAGMMRSSISEFPLIVQEQAKK